MFYVSVCLHYKKSISLGKYVFETMKVIKITNHRMFGLYISEDNQWFVCVPSYVILMLFKFKFNLYFAVKGYRSITKPYTMNTYRYIVYDALYIYIYIYLFIYLFYIYFYCTNE